MLAPFTSFYASHMTLINILGINCLLALSLYLTLSCNMLSLANAAFMGIGAYSAALLTVRGHWPYWFTIAAGAIAAGVIAVPLGLPILRLRGVYLAIVTIAFGEVMRILATILPFTGGAQGLVGIPVKTHWQEILLALIVVIYVLWRLQHSRAGRAILAIRHDEVAAAGVGIDVGRFKLAAFVGGACVAGLAGGMLAHMTRIVEPRDFGFEQAVQILMFVVVGGYTTFWGSLLGALLLTLLPEVLRSVRTAQDVAVLRQVSTGLVLLFVILFAPNGLFHVLQTLRRRHPSAHYDSGGQTTVPEVPVLP